MEEDPMAPSLTGDETRDVLARLSQANRTFAAAYPGDRADRQPVHTVYGGAHLFTPDLARKLGEAARAALKEHAPDPGAFAAAIGLSEALATRVHERVVEKLGREPVEDLRLDFEDGYGSRPDDEEDRHAVSAAHAMAEGAKQGTLPAFTGIRLKALTEENRARSLRTLDLFVGALAERNGGGLPPRFAVTLAKVTVPEQVETLVATLSALEHRLRLAEATVPIELMVETPQSVIGPRGELALPALVAAARGRCRGAHFGVYDYTAGLSITAAHQKPGHPACDFARHAMQVSLAGTGISLSDGATHVVPVGPRAAVHRAWRMHYEDVRASLRQGYYQGWDIHPAQLPTRFAAVFAFYLEARDEASARLAGFLEKAEQATLVGNVFDDAATGQALLNFFLRGLACGALTEAEVGATGLSADELRTRSFVRILDGRKAKARA
jgi:hypothetical protein